MECRKVWFLFRIRAWCHALVNLKHFEHIMLFFILLSSMFLAIEDPINSDSNINRVSFTSSRRFSFYTGDVIYL